MRPLVPWQRTWMALSTSLVLAVTSGYVKASATDCSLQGAQSSPVAGQAADRKPEEAKDALRQAYDLLAAGRTTEAEKAFQVLIDANPKEIGAFVGLAESLAAQGRFMEAVDAYRRAVALNPLSGRFRAGLAGVLERSGDAEAAIAELEAAADLEPWEASHCIALATLCQRVNRLVEAQTWSVRALGRAPENTAVYLQLGGIHEAREEWDAAIACYEAATRLAPSQAEPVLALASALNSAGKHVQAESRCRELVTRFSDNLDARLVLAAALDGQERFTEAEAEYRAVLERNHRPAIVWGNLGWTQFRAGKMADALASSSRALEIDPSLAYVRYNVGLILAVMGDREGAEHAYEEALKAGQRSDLRGAVRDLEEQLRKRPGDGTLTHFLSKLRAALHRQVFSAEPSRNQGREGNDERRK